MVAFQFILFLSCVVLLSSFAEQLIPKISLPLVQIALGVVIVMLAPVTVDVTLDPDFFLVLFIAPLLFYESKRADKLGLWRNRTVILSLAIGLVVAISLCVGFCVHALIPSIPLAAAFALGAALGPTDAVAVSAMTGSAKLGRTESARLNGEALLNDASGVVTFQFAVAAVVTGSFSAFQATTTFAAEFFGGIILGLLMGLAAYLIVKFTYKKDIGSNVFYVLFDLTIPFVIYSVSVNLEVSGILAVVAAGLLISMLDSRRVSPDQSSLNIVSDNVWKVISFTLNGIVFVMLGMQLPKAMQGIWDNVAINNTHLVIYILIITTILVVVRFCWLTLVDTIFKDPATGKRPEKNSSFWKSTLIATVGGPKGAVTLSIIFSTPYFTMAGTSFPQRDLIIFLASGVILVTLLIANFALPILAPAPKRRSDDAAIEAMARADILRNVIDRLNAERTTENARATYAVVKSYNNRVDAILSQTDMGSESTTQLRINVLKYQQNFVLRLIDTGEVDPVAGYNYIRKLSQQVGYLKHHSDGRWWVFNAITHRSVTIRVLRRYLRRTTERRFAEGGITNESEVAIKAEREAIKLLSRYVESTASPFPAEVVAQVLLDYQRTLRALLDRRPSVTAITRTNDVMEDVQRKACKYELEEIRAAQERDDIKRSTASKMRDAVYLMLVDLNTEIA